MPVPAALAQMCSAVSTARAAASLHSGAYVHERPCDACRASCRSDLPPPTRRGVAPSDILPICARGPRNDLRALVKSTTFREFLLLTKIPSRVRLRLGARWRQPKRPRQRCRGADGARMPAVPLARRGVWVVVCMIEYLHRRPSSARPVLPSCPCGPGASSATTRHAPRNRRSALGIVLPGPKPFPTVSYTVMV